MHENDAHENGAAALDAHLRSYKKIIVTLAVLTGVEFGLAYLMGHGLGFAAGVILLVGVAAWKAVLVARFFMHLRYDPRVLALIALTPVILATPLAALVAFDCVKGAGF